MRFLNTFTGVPVVDETELKEKYTYDLMAGAKDFESLRKAIREQLGLDLRKERRKLPLVVVRGNERLSGSITFLSKGNNLFEIGEGKIGSRESDFELFS